VQFKIYDAPVGGQAVWNGEVQKLTINAGMVNTLLGTKADLSRVDFDRTLYLEITIDADGNNQITPADPPLLPRQTILPAVFAKEAADSRKLAGWDWGSLLNTNDPVNGTLSGTKIADNTLPASKIADGSLPGTKLADGSIPADKIPDNALPGAKVTDSSLALGKLADEVIRRLVPPGTIAAFGGEATNVPSGWLLCDGRAVSSSQYPALFAAIGRGWGDGSAPDSDPATDFSLPDLRGLFLRGVDASPSRGVTGRDPDRDARGTDQAGGNSSNRVASIQTDEFRSHRHEAARLDSAGEATRGVGQTPYMVLESGVAGGNETRPKNAYVNYLIKY
jgi:microcystin-dependent protein